MIQAQIPDPMRALQQEPAVAMPLRAPDRGMVAEVAAYGACALLPGSGLFQLLLTGELPLGRFAWSVQNRTLPSRLRVGSLIAVPIHRGSALVIGDAAGTISVLPDRLSAILIGVTAASFLVGAGMKVISRSLRARITMPRSRLS